VSGPPGAGPVPEQYVLAVDLGTGGPKVAVVGTTGRIVASAFEPVPLYLLEGGGAEQDPEAWWAAIGIASRRAVAEADVAPADLIGVGCTAQWSGTVAVRADGTPAMRAVIWMDSRGNRAAGWPAVLSTCSVTTPARSSGGCR
jgi:xylulokinase